MSMDVNELREVLMAALPKSQQRTDEQLAAAASSYYEPLYNAQTEAAQQAHQQSDLALSQQADQLYQPYQQSLEGIAQSTAAGTSARIPMENFDATKGARDFRSPLGAVTEA